MKNTSKVIALVAVVSVVALFGCAPKPASIEITPPDVVVNAADEAPALAARVLDEKGQPIADAKVAWTSSDDKVAAVDPATGALTIKASGKAEINASIEAVKGIATVTAALYTTLKPEVEALQLKVGEVKPIAAAILNEKGEPIPGEIVWTSTDKAIAEVVGSRGEIKGIAAGATTLTATAKTLKAEVKIEVQAAGPAELKAAKEAVDLKAGKTEKVDVQALDAEGKPAADMKIAFASADAAIATVAEDGTITAVAKGETTVTATAGDKTATIKVTVK